MMGLPIDHITRTQVITEILQRLHNKYHAAAATTASASTTTTATTTTTTTGPE